MKLTKIKLLAAALVVMTMVGCSKDDGAIPKRISIENVPAMTINTDPQKAQNTDVLTLASAGTYSLAFKVNTVFPESPKPTKIDLAIRKNTTTTITNANVKTFKTDISTFPASFTITANDLSTLFGAPLALNQTYDIGVDIYFNGKKYEAFPAVGAGNGSGVSGMSAIGFWEYVRIQVK